MFRIGLYSNDKNILDKLESVLLKKYPYHVYKNTFSIEFQKEIENGMFFLDILIWDIRHGNDFGAASKTILRMCRLQYRMSFAVFGYTNFGNKKRHFERHHYGKQTEF